MSEKLPTDIRWKDFVAVLKNLGYSLYDNKRGSARTFHNPDLHPPFDFVTFHEPHGSNPIRKGTLREYINKLGITPERFLELLD